MTTPARAQRRTLWRFAWAFVMGATFHPTLLAHRYTEPKEIPLGDTYTWIKSRAEKSFRQEFQNLRFSRNEAIDFAELKLQWIDADSAIKNHGYLKQDLYVALAFQVVSVREVLTRARYPSALWAGQLDAFETKYIAAISHLPPAEEAIKQCVIAAVPGGSRLFDGLMRKSWGDPSEFDPGPQRDVAIAMLECEEDASIIEKMDSEIAALLKQMSVYQTRQRSKVPRIEFDGAYGGTVPAAVQIIWQPERGHLRVITEFDYELCSRLALDADDPKQCVRWRDVLGDELGPASMYRYFARWPDGRTRTGTLPVTFADDKKRWFLSPH